MSTVSIVLDFYHKQGTGDTSPSLFQSLYQQLDWCKSRPTTQFTELDLHGVAHHPPQFSCKCMEWSSPHGQLELSGWLTLLKMAI